MKSKKNLTRFTYETTAFQGWRLCLSRSGSTFTSKPLNLTLFKNQK